MNCIFCKIINQEISSYKIYEDDKAYVFMDINPKTNGHLLVVPKTHYNDIYELPDAELIHINNVVKKMHKHVMDKLKAKGITTVFNAGDILEVNHFHMHILPDFYKQYTLKEIEEVYQLLK